MKKQKSIPNIANELAKNRAEVRAPISSINKTLVQPVARPRMHAIPLSSLLSPSVDYGYPKLSPSPQFPALSPTVVPKLESPAEQVLGAPHAPQVPAFQLPVLDSGAIGGGARAGVAPAAEASVNNPSGQAEAAVANAPARKSAPRKKKADGAGAAAKKKAEGSRPAAKKASSRPVKKEEPAAVPSDASAGGAGTNKVVLPSQEGGQANDSPLPSDANTEDQGATPLRASPPANKTNKSLKRTQSNLSSGQKAGSQESQKARKSLSASNLGNGTTSTSPPPAAGASTAPASKKASGTSGAKKESKGKSKSAASKKKETAAASTTVPDTSSAAAIASHTPKVLAPAQPIKSPSVMDVLDQKFIGTQAAEEDDPVIVVDVPLYQVDTNDYLDENGQVVFNFYNLVHEKFNTQQNSQSRTTSSATKDRLEQGDDIAMADDDDDDDEDDEDDDDPSASGAAGASPSKSKKKSNPMKGKSRVGKYDIEDPFIDDSELLWEEQRAATKDGFFVYFGPLIQKGQYATFERVDGTMKKGGVRNPR